MTPNAYTPGSMTGERDEQQRVTDERREQAERFGEANPGPWIYSRLELVDFLRRMANGFRDGHDYAERLRQAADEIAKRDADVFMGRTK